MHNRSGAPTTGCRPFVARLCVAMAGVGFLLVTQQALAAYEIITVSNGGTLEGTVTLSGATPSKPPLKVTKNQDYCGETIPDPAYSVDGKGGLANVIVYLKDISKGKAAPAEPVSLVNEKCMFSPRAQGAMVGGQVKISSEDTVLHNTHPQNSDTNATIFNVALPFKGFSVTKPLPSMPMMIKVKMRRPRVDARLDHGARSSVLHNQRRRWAFHHQGRSAGDLYAGGVARGRWGEVRARGGDCGSNRKDPDRSRRQITRASEQQEFRCRGSP